MLALLSSTAALVASPPNLLPILLAVVRRGETEEGVEGKVCEERMEDMAVVMEDRMPVWMVEMSGGLVILPIAIFHSLAGVAWCSMVRSRWR